ncbi:hypothetical protein ACEWY4_023121 [Coilia grayii]|uniref:CARD domain-containing protein n=1 Tax=Coilia grayii TaxID=363190 RepID=A0ABD1J240_9TELE
MEFIQSNKDTLCTLLANRLDEVMGHVEDVITMKENKAITKLSGEKAIKLLLEVMDKKGEERCQELAEFLRETFLEIRNLSSSQGAGPVAYADQGSTIVAAETSNATMKSYKMQVNVDGQQGCNAGPSQVCPPVGMPSSGSRMVATNNSHIFAPKLTCSTVAEDVEFSFNFTAGSKSSQSSGKNTGNMKSCSSVSDKLAFFRENYSDLIQKVKNAEPIVDELFKKGFHQEMVANVRAEPTPQSKMRKILEVTTTKSAAEALFQALLTHEKALMDELIKS